MLKILKKAEPFDKEVLPFLIADKEQAHPTTMKLSGMAAGYSAKLGFVIIFHSYHYTSINEQPSQHLQHIFVGEVLLNPHSQTLPRVFVNHYWRLKAPMSV